MMKFSRAIKNLLGKKQDTITAIPAVLGDKNGIVNTGQKNYVYARAGDTVISVFNNRVNAQYGLPVMIGYDPAQPGILQVLSTRDVGNIGNTQHQVPGHHENHEYPYGSDIVYMQLRQFLPLRLTPLGGFKVAIYRAVVWANGFKVVNDTLDLLQYRPTQPFAACYVLITVSNDGNINVTKGNEVNISELSLSNIPQIPPTAKYVVGAIRLYASQTEIRESGTDTDIVDLRYPIWHTHSTNEIQGTIGDMTKSIYDANNNGVVDLAEAVDWTGVQNKPSVFPPALHTHVEADITDLDHNAVKLQGRNVSATAPTDGQVLAWDDVNSQWKPSTVAGTGDMTKAVYDTNNNGIVDAAESVPWSGVTGKPSTFPPETHNHDERYYTETELNTSGAGGQVHWDNVSSKPSTYPPSAHQHAAGDVTSGTFDAARIPNLDASKITSGTLSTDRFSAYTDLGSENRLGMAQDRLLRGQDARLIFVALAEDFLGEGGIPSGWYWAGSPFVTPNTIYRWGNSHLYVQNAGVAPSRCFLVTNLSSAIPSLFGINAVGNNGFYVGLRLDDGSDNNYVELVNMVEGSPYLRSFAIRHRTGGGAVSTGYLYQNQPIYADTISAWYSGTQWSNWNIHADAWLMYIRREHLGSTYVLGRTWIPARRGIVFNFVYEWNHVLIDAVS